MNNLTFIEKLLDGAGVEFKTIDSVFDIFAGGDVPKESFSEIPTEEFKIPILSNGIGDKALYGWTDKAKIEKPSLTISARGTIGWTNFVDKPFFPIVRLLVITPKNGLNLKYAYYFMKTIENSYRVPPAGIPQLTKPMLKDVRIPIPCPENPEKSLEIQAKIVGILDTFSAMIAELVTELNNRKKQYDYYRNQLLNFKDDEVEWKTLGDISLKISSGGTPKTGVAEYWEGGTIPWMSSGEVNLETIYETEKYITEAGLKSSSAKFIPKNSIVIALAGQGKTRGKVARTRIDLTTNQSLASLTFDEMIVNPDYIYHFLKTQYENLRQISSGNGARGGLNLQMISNYKLPIPALSRQASIVAILDKFDVLTSSNTEGLPREIALRQKQYEYYRDLLLSFPQRDLEAIV
jgi:type I restriction enzyme S subunit